MSNETTVLVTGGFDPIHSGHINYFHEAKKLGDKLVVGLNSDEWLSNKKGRPFMPLKERITVVKNLSVVDNIITFEDDDGSANQAIFKLLATTSDKIIFANGGDRSDNNTPEYKAYWQHPRINFKFNVGGEKTNSSSWILEEWKSPKTERPWGYYRILHEDGVETKVKELTVNPGGKLSMQRHSDRKEHWLVSHGKATVYTISSASSDFELMGEYKKHDSVHIAQNEWHMLTNETKEPCRIVEIQFGKSCREDDILRVEI